MFGEELRRLRTQAGLSLNELAGKVHYSKGYLSRLENGRQAPSRDIALACDHALDAGGALARLGPPQTRRAEDDIPTEPERTGPEVWIMAMNDDGGTHFTGLDRRSALSLGGGVLAGIAIPPPVGRAGFSESSLAGFRTQLAHLRGLGQHTPPAMMVPLVIAHTNALRRLARDAPSRHRAPAIRLAARFAEYTGWMAQEAGNDQAALWWTDTAAAMARESGSPDLDRYALVRRALVSLYAQDGERTVELAAAADDPAASPRVRALAAKREAQGHALLGDRTACERALKRARDLLPPVSSPDPEILGSSHVPDPVGVTWGWCLVDLALPREAAEILDRETALLPPDAVRSRLRFGVRRALAHALAGEIDHACRITGELLDTPGTTMTATVVADLRRLVWALNRHRGHRSVRDLSPRLAAALRQG
ncbi:helix-turn-helix domain-containing protein [Nocardiopsis sp. NPDC057823]|uniref:helix-turn-helix domain-containing protein n=1 Tax=Nocardiopsis sp. NPDC057823 TaxID=3346256 RepID=UPI00366CB2CF